VNYSNHQGLSDQQVLASRREHGSNKLNTKSSPKFLLIILDTAKEPMFLLLVFTAMLYFVLGESSEGITMLVALCLVAGISIYQENRSHKAEEALKQFTSPQSKVIRAGQVISEKVENLVVGDIIILEKGDLIPADGEIVEAHDFSVNEGIVTGESVSVLKNTDGNKILHGTLVEGGAALATITAVGQSTFLNSLGKTMSEVEVVKTPLQISLNKFVKQMVGFGLVAFFLVWGMQFYLSGSWTFGLLKGLTLAMSVIPEEIPVAFSTFMALGAYKMFKQKVLIKSPYAVEALGSTSVLCADKTGTLTENRMELAAVYDAISKQIIWKKDNLLQATELVATAMWASEPEPFDGMEKAIHEAYSKLSGVADRKEFSLIYEYPLTGSPPIMTHIFKHRSNNTTHIAVKGGLEALLPLCKKSAVEMLEIQLAASTLQDEGYRIIGVGKSEQTFTEWPAAQTDFEFELTGFLVFFDPPKAHIKSTISMLKDAGITVKMITGDFEKTAASIAKQCGLEVTTSLTGKDIMDMNDEELRKKVNSTNVFARMFPQAKLRVIEALKHNGEIVAMTGDGVNDGPALKAAHIGIAMGKRGSELARNASAMVLLDDDLSHIIRAVETGRNIYNNLKKAILYIIAIHIPIILIVTLPLLLFWEFNNIFTPVHVIFLELIMGPTCSIVFENEPVALNLMKQKSRKVSTSFLYRKDMLMPLIYGLSITFSCLTLGYLLKTEFGQTEGETRAAIYTTLILCNIFLTLSVRSNQESIFKTWAIKNNLMPYVFVGSLALLAAALFIPLVQNLLDFDPLQLWQIGICAAVAFLTILSTDQLKLVVNRGK